MTILVEPAIDQLVLEFIDLPYLHRVEHSLHCELYALLTANRTLGRPYPLVDGTLVQLVHKEWPETAVRPGKTGRGNFDRVVLQPSAVSKATVTQFEQGRVIRAGGCPDRCGSSVTVRSVAMRLLHCRAGV